MNPFIRMDWQHTMLVVEAGRELRKAIAAAPDYIDAGYIFAEAMLKAEKAVPVSHDEVGMVYSGDGILLRDMVSGALLWVDHDQVVIQWEALQRIQGRPSFRLRVLVYNNDYKANLLQLARGLRSPLTTEFEMAVYARNEVCSPGAWDKGQKEYNHCGTSGCALGHSLQLVRPRPVNMPWSLYAYVMYGFAKHSPEVQWCFDGGWSGVDDTAIGAAERIEYFVKHGVPDNYQAQEGGDADLCYKGFVYQE